MNIFVLDTNPHTAAEFQCDKHVVKMVLETAQILSTVHHMYGTDDERLYKPTHQHHPCTVWTAQSGKNYDWLYSHFVGLAYEYRHRYYKNHKTWLNLMPVLMHKPDSIPEIGYTPFALAMPDEYKCDDPVESYRAYYRGAKADMLTYRNRNQPYWLNN